MGHGSEKRNQALAIRCAKLAAENWTHREIAELVGKKSEQIKSLILTGQRILSTQPNFGRERRT